MRKDILTKIIPTNFNEKKVICKFKCFFILLRFLLITMISLITAIKYQKLLNLICYQTKQKYFHFMMLVIKKSILKT